MHHIETYTDTNSGDTIHDIKVRLASLRQGHYTIQHRLWIYMNEGALTYKAWQVYVAGNWITYKHIRNSFAIVWHDEVLAKYLTGVEFPA
jgi:pyrroloquinoline quinone (PQQ) biosynthesis protein C